MNTRNRYLIDQAELAMGSSFRVVEQIKFLTRLGWLVPDISIIERQARSEAAKLI